MTTRLVGQRGSVLIHVSAALAAFTALTALMVNVALLLVGRNEIQTAVDAASVAGATALAFDSYTDRSETGPAVTAALAMADENLVRNGSASVTAADVVFPKCKSSYIGAPSTTDRIGCVRVTAYRDEEHDNPIPALFATLLGVPSYGVAATATADAIDANTTDCLKPLAVPDRWNERRPVVDVWRPNSTFDRWDPANPALLLTPRDNYDPPSDSLAGSGVQMTGEVANQVWFGKQVTLSPGSLTTPIATVASWMYLPIQIPGSVWGPNAVRDNTHSCAGAPGKVSIGATIGIAPGGVGANAPLVAAGLNDLIALDPTATWNAATQRVENSCADVLDPDARCASMSPRIIAIALYDPHQFADASKAGIPAQVHVRNIVGFFVESVSGNDATGWITRHPGQFNPGAITLLDASAFLRAPLLVE